MAGPGKLSWDSVEVWQKLVAAIIASGVKIDVSNVATHFGTTYDTIENRLRPVKKQAKLLRDAVNNGTQDKVTSTRKSPTKPRTPKKSAGALDIVSNGRVTKTTPSGRASKKSQLKQEAIENSFGSLMEEDFADVESTNDTFGPLDFETGMANLLD